MKTICTSFFVCICSLSVYSQKLNPQEWPNLKGYWEFQDSKDLTKPTVGSNLTLVGTHQQVAGAAYGDTAIRIAVGSYYKCNHTIPPNGGGDSVNRYTLMFDFKVLNFNRWHTFFQTDTPNANDGECFIRPITGSNPGRIGTATTGYTPDSINPNQWYRMVISVNLNNFYRYYLNGKLVLDGDTQDVDGRFALLPQVLLFADNDKEDDTIDIASVAIFDTCLTSNDIARLGSIEPCIANPPKINLGRDTTLCAGNSLALKAGANYVKYQWSTGNKSPFETVDTTNLGLGKKAVWVKVTDRNGCTGSDTISIEFLPSPETRIITSCPSPQYKGCIIARNSLKYTNHNYVWVGLPKGDTLSMSDSLIICSSGNYTLNLTSPFGCAGHDTIDIVLNNISNKPNLTIIGKTSFCMGDSLKLKGPDGYSAYHWSNGDTLQNAVIRQSDSISLIVKDSMGCESPSSDTTRVLVFELPATPLIQVIGNTTFCDGDSLVINTVAGFVQYIWPDTLLTKPTRAIRTAGNFKVFVRDSNNCFSAASNSIFVTVLQIPAKPVVSFIGKTTICDGETAKLSAPSGYPGYLWNDSSKTKDIVVGKSGNLGVIVFGINGCPSIWSDNISVVVNAIPPKPKVVLGSNDSLKSNTSASQYKWYLNGTSLADSTRTIYALHTGYFQVQIAEKECWSKLSDSFYFKNIGVKELKDVGAKLLIFPNPSTNTIAIQIQNFKAKSEVLITVYDMQGKMFWEANRSFSEINAGVTIDLEHLDRGIYFVKVLSSSLLFTGRFEKQ